MKTSELFANLLIASTPGGIEAQEKQGQTQQATAQTLPRKLDRRQFETLGFVFGENVDDLFVSVQFPEGWAKRPTDHSMWTDIVDQFGRKRGGIFYKAAFYDRDANAHLSTRFGVSVSYNDDTRTVYVRDALELVKKEISGLQRPDWNGDRERASEAVAKIDAAEKELREWLDENYPNWTYPETHWDAPDA